MANGFPNIIKQALEAVNYSGPKDNERFRAAVQDLSADFPEERKFFLRNTDDRFLQICGTAMDCGRDQVQVKVSQAADYLVNEYWMGEQLSKDFAAKVVTGFRLYAKGSEEEAEAEEKARREAKERARREAEESVRREAEERARREAEESVRKEAEEKAKREADGKKENNRIKIALTVLLVVFLIMFCEMALGECGAEPEYYTHVIDENVSLTLTDEWTVGDISKHVNRLKDEGDIESAEALKTFQSEDDDIISENVIDCYDIPEWLVLYCYDASESTETTNDLEIIRSNYEDNKETISIKDISIDKIPALDIVCSSNEDERNIHRMYFVVGFKLYEFYYCGKGDEMDDYIDEVLEGITIDTHED